MNATNACGTSSDFVTVNINPLPLTDAGFDVSICSGSPTNLLASGGLTYSWTPTTGLSNANISNPTAVPFVTTSYIVSATNACGAWPDTVLVTVDNPVTISAGADLSVCLGSTITLNATSSAGNYAWLPATGLSSATIANPVATIATTTTFTVTSTNSCGSQSDAVKVTVNPVPTANAGPDRTICIGNSTTLMGSGTGTSYSWSPTTGLDNPTIAAPLATPSASTNYTITVTDANNCKKTDLVIVTVNPCVGIGKVFAGNGIEIYPNPFSSSLTVELKVPIKDKWDFELYDILERKILTQKLSNSITTVNRGELPAGIYLWKVRNAKGAMLGSGKVVIE